MTNKISTIIVIKNIPTNFKETLRSVNNISDEIILIDIGLNDKKFFLKNKKIKVIKFSKSVPYVELIREETKKYAKNNWLLFLDPDEILTDDLKKIITKKINNNSADYFLIPRKNFIFDQWIKHSRWWPDYQIRVFKKNKVFWPKTLHSQPITQGKEFLIEAKEELAIVHYNYNNLDQYLEKAKRYAKSEAEFLTKNNKELNLTITIKKSLSEFISRYFTFQGYKDGVVGFVLAWLQMFYYFLVYFYYLEMKKFINNEEINPESFFKAGLKETLHWKKNQNLINKLIKKLL